MARLTRPHLGPVKNITFCQNGRFDTFDTNCNFFDGSKVAHVKWAA